MPHFRLTLRTKTIIHIVSMIVLTVSVFLIYEVPSGIARREAAAEQAFRSLTSTVQNGLDSTVSKNGSLTTSFENLLASYNTESISVIVYSPDGIFINTIPSSINERFDEIQNLPKRDIWRFGQEESEYIATVVHSNKSAYFYAIVQNITQQLAVGRQQIETTFLFAIVVLCVVATLTSLFMQRNVLVPIQRIKDATTHIAQGDFSTTVKQIYQDEIGDLTENINVMTKQLDTYVTRLQNLDKIKEEFILLLSHNLRTPLTRIRGGLEILMKGGSNENHDRALSGMKGASDELYNLIEKLLDMVTLEVREQSVTQVSDVDMKRLIDDIVDSYHTTMEQKGVSLEYAHTSDAVIVKGIVKRLSEAIGHVLENAIKFSPAGSTVSISVNKEPNQAVIVIADTGPGISPATQKLLFEKFKRGTDILRAENKGLGLGLYISKLIIEQHDGTIDLQSIEHEGTTVTITLPLTTDN